MEIILKYFNCNLVLSSFAWIFYIVEIDIDIRKLNFSYIGRQIFRLL